MFLTENSFFSCNLRVYAGLSVLIIRYGQNKCLVFNYLHPTGSAHGGYMKYYILAKEIKAFLLLHVLFYYQIGFPQKKK